MASDYGFIFVLLAVLIVVIVFFAIVDYYLKNSGKKKTVEKKPAAKPVVEEKPKEVKPTEPKSTPVMKIYNSELADDLNKIIKETDTSQTSRLNVESHLGRESNISKYIHEKNYQGFHFDAENDNLTEEDETMTFTREDYKRFMALSNIDDKK